MFLTLGDLWFTAPLLSDGGTDESGHRGETVPGDLISGSRQSCQNAHCIERESFYLCDGELDKSSKGNRHSLRSQDL